MIALFWKTKTEKPRQAICFFLFAFLSAFYLPICEPQQFLLCPLSKQYAFTSHEPILRCTKNRCGLQTTPLSQYSSISLCKALYSVLTTENFYSTLWQLILLFGFFRQNSTLSLHAIVPISISCAITLNDTLILGCTTDKKVGVFSKLHLFPDML